MTTTFVSRLAAVMFALTGLLVLLHVCVHALDKSNFFRIMFDLENEANVPTWFASILWFLAAVYALVAYQNDEHYRPKPAFNKVWLLIALGFTFASLDEVARIHERVAHAIVIHSAGHTAIPHGVLGNWVVLYAPALVVFSLLAGNHLWRRCKRQTISKACLAGAAICYATALGLECGEQNRTFCQFMLREYKSMATTRWPWLLEEALEDLATACMVISIARYASLGYAGQDVTVRRSRVPDDIEVDSAGQESREAALIGARAHSL